MPNQNTNMLLNTEDETQVKEVNGHPLTFNHLNKLYWPDDGFTKRDMINYYDQVAPYMLTYLLDRPVSLNRFPNGINDHSFFQKDITGISPEWVDFFEHTTAEGEEQHYLVTTNEASLLWMAGLGCIEINPWFSRVFSPDNPDYCVIDLDPGANTFSKVIQIAQVIKNILDATGVTAYPKTSGSTGIHIYIPLGARFSYAQSSQLAKRIVTLAQKQASGYTTVERLVKKRQGKMYLDFLQNHSGATIAAPYSLRPKPGATVSMPLSWDEVKPGLTMRDFNIHNAADRLKETGDLFQGVLDKGIDLPGILQEYGKYEKEERR